MATTPWYKSIGTMLPMLITISTIVGLLFTVDSRWAKAGEFKQLNQRFEVKVAMDRADRIQDRLWKLEDRHGCNLDKMPASVKEDYRSLQKEKIELERYIGEMNKLK